MPNDPPARSSTVLDRFLNGWPFEAPVIDAHLHLPPSRLYYRLGGETKIWHPSFGAWTEHTSFHNVASLVSHMDRLGVSKVFAYINGFEKLEEGTEVVRRFPGRFLPAVAFWPGRGREGESFADKPVGRIIPDSKAELDSILQHIRDLGWKGIKIWDQKAPGPLDWFYDTLLSRANEERWLVQCHSWGSPAILDAIAARYPDVTLVMGHALESRTAMLAYAEVFRKRQNVYATTTNLRHPGSLEVLVEALGAGRILMGSDAVGHTMEFALGNIAMARIPDGEKRRILGGNMQDLLTRLGYLQTWGA